MSVADSKDEGMEKTSIGGKKRGRPPKSDVSTKIVSSKEEKVSDGDMFDDDGSSKVREKIMERLEKEEEEQKESADVDELSLDSIDGPDDGEEEDEEDEDEDDDEEDDLLNAPDESEEEVVKVKPKEVKPKEVKPKEEVGMEEKIFHFERKDLPLEQIQTHPTFRNSRRRPGDISGLMVSLQEKGLQTPLIVWGIPCEPVEISGVLVDEQYYLIAGFRRHSAMTNLNISYPGMFKKVPVHVFHGTHDEAAEINLTENIQREDLTPFEIGQHMVYLMEQFNWTQRDLGDRFGKSQPYVSFAVKMAKGDGIIPDLLELIKDNRINLWAAQSVAYRTIEEQTAFVEQYKKALESGRSPKEAKEKGTEEADKQKVSRKRKIRSTAEVKETLDVWAKAYLGEGSDKKVLGEIQAAHVSGILKALYWMLNHEVDWNPIVPEKWGFVYEPMEE